MDDVPGIPTEMLKEIVDKEIKAREEKANPEITKDDREKAIDEMEKQLQEEMQTSDDDINEEY